ncbi:MAG: carbon storage regulator CsrA [Planctomycetes bacterium]|nr:carbon storage regulator CsrA [Planctomycetota bacterium]
MLVVSRKVGERIIIGDKITVTVVKIGSGGVRIGIDAPTEMAVMREELSEKIRQEERDRQLRAEEQSHAESQSLEAAQSPNTDGDPS